MCGNKVEYGILYELAHSISYKIACPLSNDRSAVIASRSAGSQTSKISLDRQKKFCLDSVGAQADLSLRRAQMPSCRTSCDRHIYINICVK